MSSSTDEGIKWYPRVTVERYSAWQTAWAQQLLDRAASWNHKLSMSSGLLTDVLHGDLLRELFPDGPEDGYARDEGNSMVNGGLANLVSLLTGAAPSGSTGRPLTLGAGGAAAGSACVGVGSDGTTAFAATQTHLANASGEGSGNSFYQSMDSGYPTLTLPNQLNGQSTFLPADAVFNWLEWCWASGAGVPTPGPVLASVYATAGSAAMLNRKIPVASLGDKKTGAAWVFQTTVGFS